VSRRGDSYSCGPKELNLKAADRKVYMGEKKGGLRENGVEASEETDRGGFFKRN